MLPARQDDYLDAGYFRSGHTIRQTRFLFVDRAMWSTIWSRVPLQTYTLRKSQRKLWRRVNARFTYDIGPYQPRDDQDLVYHRYQEAHPLDVGRTLIDIFGAHQPTHTFRTHAVRIYDRSELIAFSCFDLGERSLASLFGCYLPEYSAFSLGSFTLFAEMDFGRREGLEHYHPGYCVPGLAAFAYKLRLPNLEGRTFTMREWRPMAEVTAEPLPTDIIDVRTGELAVALKGLDVPSLRAYMPLCEFAPLDDQHYGAIPLPLALQLPSVFSEGDIFAGYEPASGTYQLWFGVEVANLAHEPDFDQMRSQVPARSNLKFYEWRRRLLISRDLESFVKLCAPDKLPFVVLREVPVWVLGNQRV